MEQRAPIPSPQLPPPPSARPSPWGAPWSPEEQPASPRRSPLPVAVVGLVVVVAIAAVVFLVPRGGDGWPASIDGLQRLDTASAHDFERSLADAKFAGVRIQGAMYGTGETPQLMVERFVGDTEGLTTVPLDSLMEGAAGGLNGSGAGTVDQVAVVRDTRADVEYQCMPIRFVGPAATALAPAGSMCAWSGADVGLVVTLRSPEPSLAVDDAVAVYSALH